MKVLGTICQGLNGPISQKMHSSFADLPEGHYDVDMVPNSAHTFLCVCVLMCECLCVCFLIICVLVYVSMNVCVLGHVSVCVLRGT